jgi:phosphoglycolate phosphatase-like HAD superfamily hydrolase
VTLARASAAIACVVLDLDGTLTDLAFEAPAFRAAFPRLLADLLGRDLGPAYQEEERRVRELSPELSWMVEGRGVAPADADPYVLASAVAHRIFDRLHVLADPALRGDVVSAVLHRAYRETPGAFRPEAGAVIEALLARGLAVHVVTNAAADVAARKLAALAPACRDRVRVRGDARKFLVGPPACPDERFDRVPAEIRLPGLERPVLPGRGRYFDALAAIWAETSAGPETTLVCGDIFELDLALPAALGAHVHLVARPDPHAYEIDAVRALGARGGVSEGLLALLDRVP